VKVQPQEEGTLKGTHRLLAICAALALVVAACGDDNESSGGGSASSSGGGEKKNYKMTLVAGVKGDEFYITMNCGAQEKAKELGVTLDFQGPDEFDASQQTPVVNAVAAKKPDAMLVAPTDTKAMFAPIKQVADAGSKVVLVDTTLEQPDMAVSQIASDNKGGGAAAAETLKQLMGDAGGKVYVSNVKPGISTTDLREEGFVAKAKELGLDYAGRNYNNDKPETAAAQVKAALAKDPDIKGIFATNLFGAEGAATGVREAGAKDVKIVGFDAGPKQVEDLKQGIVQALIAQKPAEIGATGVEQAYNALTGKPTTAKIATGFTSITQDNLAENQDNVYKASC
jgi:ribose transport system substrate-binding protein